MSVPRLRPTAAPVLAIVAIALGAATALLCAGVALADSDAPPTETTSHAGPLVIVGCVVITLVLISLIVLSGIVRSRRNKRISEEYPDEREAKLAEEARPGTPIDGGDS